MTQNTSPIIDTRIRYSHKWPSGEYVYNVYCNHRFVGLLTRSFTTNKYYFQSTGVIPLSVKFKYFDSLTQACEQLPDLLPIWIATAALNGVK